MLSSSFIKDSGSPHLIAPIISFKVVEGEMVALTPLPEKFINLILAYTGIFNCYEDIKQHIEVDMFPNGDGKFCTGTEIYLCSLRQKFHSFDCDIYYVEDFKKRDSQELVVQTQQTTTTEDLLQEDLHHSLITQIKYSYIDFPARVNLRVNDGFIDAQNPFGNIIKYVLQDEKMAIKGQSKFYKYWIISEMKLKEMGVSEEILSKFEGLLIYKGNEFVKKDEMSQPQRIIQQCHHNRFATKIGKRNYQQMKKAGLATPLLHGIIMIESDCEFSQLTYDKQDLAHENFLDFIREDITQAYLDWDGIEETEVLSEEQPDKKFAKTDGKSLEEKNLMLQQIIDQQQQEIMRFRSQFQTQQKQEPNLANESSQDGQQELANHVQYLMTQEEFQAMSELEQQQYLNELKMNYHFGEQYQQEMEFYHHQQQMQLMAEDEFEMIEQQQNDRIYPGYPLPGYPMPPPVFEVKKEEKAAQQ